MFYVVFRWLLFLVDFWWFSVDFCSPFIDLCCPFVVFGLLLVVLWWFFAVSRGFGWSLVDFVGVFGGSYAMCGAFCADLMRVVLCADLMCRDPLSH